MSGLGRLAGRSLAVCDEGKCCRTRHVLRSLSKLGEALDAFPLLYERPSEERPGRRDRKSTRLNSSHITTSYAVFCLQKKKKQEHNDNQLVQKGIDQHDNKEHEHN